VKRAISRRLLLIGAFVSAAFAAKADEPESRRRLEQAYGTISVLDRDKPSQKKLIRSVFDLDNREVSEFMIEAMNRPQQRGMRSAAQVMACILDVNPGKGIGWLIDHRKEFTVAGRSHLIESLRFLNAAEAYEIVLELLGDHSVTVVPDREPTDDYQGNLRVCDYACNTLQEMTEREHKSKSARKRWIFSSTKIEDRNRIVEYWSEWRKNQWPTICKSKPSLADDTPGLKDKIIAFQRQSEK
jgi:hypothetical protein